MSETEGVEIDSGEPPSPGDVGYNFETDEVFDQAISEYYRVRELCQEVDKLLGLHIGADRLAEMEEQAHMLKGQYGQVAVETGYIEKNGITLKRILVGSANKDESLYFYNEPDTGYCRSWSNQGIRINWCNNEKRFEPALDVQARVLDSLKPDEAPVEKHGRFAGLIRRIVKLDSELYN